MRRGDHALIEVQVPLLAGEVAWLHALALSRAVDPLDAAGIAVDEAVRSGWRASAGCETPAAVIRDAVQWMMRRELRMGLA